MTFQQIRYLTAVAEAGSISHAAEQLYVAQSSVSSAIREVENEYAITIFERTPKGVIPTHKGREFLSDIQYIMDYQKYIDTKYGISKLEEKTALSISALHHVCGDGAFFYFLQHSKTNDFRYDYLEGSPIDVINNVSSGKSDIGILFFTISAKNMFMQEIERRSLIFHHMAYTNMFIYVRKSHPLAAQKQVSLADMANYPFISYDYQNPDAAKYTSSFGQHNHSHKIFHISDRATAYSLLRRTDAYATGSGYVSADESYADIVSIPIYDTEKIEVGWLSRGQYILSELASTFVELLEKSYSSLN